MGSVALPGGRVPYRWGEILHFTEGGNAVPFFGDGWSRPEAGIVWTQSQNARLSFSINPPKSDVLLIISCLPFLVEKQIPHQELHVYVNFLRVGFSLIPGPGEVEFRIPARVFGTSELDIDFYLPKACSPAAIGTGQDVRDLGLAVNQFVMFEN